MYTLFAIRPAQTGAAYGKATVSEPVSTKKELQEAIERILMTETGADKIDAMCFGLTVLSADPGWEIEHTSGLVFRFDVAPDTPNACGCCGRLVKLSDHAFAGTEDAYCTGCYLWGDTDKIGCDPKRTAHANPWTADMKDAGWYMEVIIDRGDETDSDYRYSATDPEELGWDDTENALIAWPGLTAEQILEVTITEINREN